MARIEALSAAERFEDAATIRTRLIAFLRTAIRMQRLVSPMRKLRGGAPARRAPIPRARLLGDLTASPSVGVAPRVTSGLAG